MTTYPLAACMWLTDSEMKLITPQIVWHSKQPVFTADFHKNGPNWRLATGGADNDIKVKIGVANSVTDCQNLVFKAIGFCMFTDWVTMFGGCAGAHGQGGTPSHPPSSSDQGSEFTLTWVIMWKPRPLCPSTSTCLGTSNDQWQSRCYNQLL